MIDVLHGADTRILCFGNRLHGDDGVGCHVHDALARGPLPAGVSLHDAGTAGLGALLFFEGCRHVVIVDALEHRGHPGRLWRLSASKLLDIEAALSTHAQGLSYLLQVLPLAMPRPPEIEVIGVEVLRVEAFSEALTPPVASAVPKVAARVRSLLPAAARNRATHVEGPLSAGKDVPFHA